MMGNNFKCKCIFCYKCCLGVRLFKRKILFVAFGWLIWWIGLNKTVGKTHVKVVAFCDKTLHILKCL